MSKDLTWPDTAPQPYGRLRSRGAGVMVDGVPVPIAMDYSAELVEVLRLFDALNRGLTHHHLAPWRFTIWVANNWGVTFAGFRPPWEFKDPHLTEWKDDFRPISITDYVRVQVKARNEKHIPDAVPVWCREPAGRVMEPLQHWVETNAHLPPADRAMLKDLFASAVPMT